MKMIALGTTPGRPAAAPSEQQAKTGPRTLYAAVAARDKHGAPTVIALPGPVGGGRVGLYSQHPNGSPLWLADVLEDGAVKSDGTRQDGLARLRPGTKIVAAVGADGRVVALTALRPEEDRCA